MSIIGIPLPGNVGVSLSEQPVEVPAPELSAGELSGYRKSMPKSDAVEKWRDPISENARDQMWMFPSLSIFSDSEYVYAISPISVSLSRGKGGREIAESRPVSMIFVISSHVLNKPDVNNYSVRTAGKWSCEDTMVEWSVPLAPLEDWEMPHNGPNPRSVVEDAPKTFYWPLFALALSTLRFKKMSFGAAQGPGNLSAIGNLESELSRRGFEAVDLLSAFVKPDGSKMDLEMRLSPEFGPKSELPSGRSKVLTKTDCAVVRDSRTGKHTSRLYNYFSKQFVGNYKNWAIAQPVKDWRLGSFKWLMALAMV